MSPTTKLNKIDSRVLDALESLETVGDEVTEWNHTSGTLGDQIAGATLRNLVELRGQVERLEMVLAMALADRGVAVVVDRETA